MSIYIANNKKNRKILDEIFKNAPKTFKEALEKGKCLPIPKGMKYDVFIKDFIKIQYDLNKQKENIINSKF